jgi:hypothetical protein
LNESNQGEEVNFKYPLRGGNKAREGLLRVQVGILKMVVSYDEEER